MKLRKFTACAMAMIMLTMSLSACSSDSNDKAEDNGSKNNSSVQSASSSNKGEGEGFGNKEETVYVTTLGDGTVSKILVSEWLKNTESYSSLKDVTTLSDIVNVKGDEKFTVAGDEISFDTSAGNDIYYQGSLDASTELPVSLKITYSLDGSQISASEIQGKSGKLAMTIEYMANKKTGEDMYIPFLAVTGMLLPAENFKNITVTNGQVISNGDYNILVGMGIPGIAESLKLEIPNTVEITADVTNYNIDMMLTVVTNKIFSEGFSISGDDLEGLDSIKDMVTLLSESSIKLADGALALKDGLAALKASSQDLIAGVEKLNSGAATLDAKLKELAAGAASLRDGIKGELLTGASSLNEGLKQLYDGAGQINDGVGTLTETMGNMTAEIQKTIADNKAAIADIEKKKAAAEAALADLQNKKTALEAAIKANPSDSTLNAQLQQVAGGIAQYEQGIAEANAGIYQYMGANTALTEILSKLTAKDSSGLTLSDKLKALALGTQTLEAGSKTAMDGSKELLDGINNKLVSGSSQIASGSSQLSEGAAALAEGLSELNSKLPALTEGIDKLVAGSSELSDGMKQFNESAIQKIAEVYNNDFQSAFEDLEKIAAAGREYQTLTGVGENATGTSTFIIKTAN